MKQRDIERLSEYLDGRLNPSDAARLESRLASDPALASALEALRETRMLLRRLPQRRAPHNFTLTPKMVGRKPPLPRTYPILRFATVVATLLFGLSFLQIRPIAFGAAAPRAEYGIGGGAPATEAPAMVEAAPAEPMVATESPAATEPPLKLPAPAATAPAEDRAPTAMALIPQTPTAAPALSPDHTEPEAESPKTAEQPVLTPWQMAIGLIALLGTLAMSVTRRLATRKWRVK